MSRCGSNRRSDSEQAARRDWPAVVSSAAQAGRLVKFNLFHMDWPILFQGEARSEVLVDE